MFLHQLILKDVEVLGEEKFPSLVIVTALLK